VRVWSTPVQRNRSFDDLPGTMRVDIHALSPVARHHDEIGGESATFDVKLEAIALRIADRRAAGAAAALGPAAADLILVIGRELADEIEIIAVTCAPKLELDFALAASGAVSGVATDTLGSSVLRAQRSGAGPAARKLGERTHLRQCRQSQGEKTASENAS